MAAPCHVCVREHAHIMLYVSLCSTEKGYDNEGLSVSTPDKECCVSKFRISQPSTILFYL